MKGILFKPDAWKAKLHVLADHGEAETRRAEKVLEGINKWPDQWRLINGLTDNRFIVESKVSGGWHYIKPRYQVGEIVYVKEAYWQDQSGGVWGYKVDGIEWPPLNCGGKAVSPLFIPEWAARYFIRFLDVKAERVHEITEEGAKLEGFPTELEADIEKNPLSIINRGIYNEPTSISWYKALWDSINPQYPWESNPWEFAYRFKLEKALT